MAFNFNDHHEFKIIACDSTMAKEEEALNEVVQYLLRNGFTNYDPKSNTLWSHTHEGYGDDYDSLRDERNHCDPLELSTMFPDIALTSCNLYTNGMGDYDYSNSVIINGKSVTVNRIDASYMEEPIRNKDGWVICTIEDPEDNPVLVINDVPISITKDLAEKILIAQQKLCEEETVHE